MLVMPKHRTSIAFQADASWYPACCCSLQPPSTVRPCCAGQGPPRVCGAAQGPPAVPRHPGRPAVRQPGGRRLPAAGAWRAPACPCPVSRLWAPGVCVTGDAAAVMRRSHQCCRHPSQCVCLKFALQEASLAEAEEALAASKLCGTRQLDWPQVLAEERQRFEQEQQHEQQHWQPATVGVPQS